MVCLFKKPVESFEEKEFGRLFGFQKQGTKCGAQGEGVEPADYRRDGDRQGELFVQLAGDAADKGRGNKYGQQYEHNTHNSSRHFLHGLDHRLFYGGIPAGFDQPVTVFYDDNGVVYYQPDSQYQPEESQRIDGKSQHRHEGESPDQRDGNRDQRNQHRPPVLEEDQNNQ